MVTGICMGVTKLPEVEEDMPYCELVLNGDS